MGPIIFYILSVFCDFIICTQIDSKIYMQINKFQACVQLANATHQIGCTSPEKGNRGTIHLINSEKDIDWLIKEGPYAPYIPLFDPPMFSQKSMKRLMDSKKISGALVILKNSSVNISDVEPYFSSSLPTWPFSPDPVCPMDDFGVYKGDKEYGGCKKVKWNAQGNGMSMIYYGIPIFSLSDSGEIKRITECAKKHNYDENGKAKGYPLCAVEMKDFMFSAKDTPTCMRKSRTTNPIQSTYCDALGDQNIFGTLYPLVEELQEDDIIMASTKIDSTGFFHEIAPGGDNGITGIVTLLTVAYTLGEYKRSMLEKNIVEDLKPIVFTFFNGEVWDYIGSSRMVWDMEKGKFPYPGKKSSFNGTIDDSTSVSKINTSHIGYFMEISQVGKDKDGVVYAHSDPVSQKNKKVKSRVDTMMKALEKGASLSGQSFKVVERDGNHPLPPASFQRFLRSRRNIAGVLLADHEKEFVNKFYNSRFDNGENLGIGRNSRTGEIHGSLPSNLTILSEAIANALYYLASNGSKPKQKLTAPRNLTADLLKCFLYTANCAAFREISDEKNQFAKLPINVYQRYISIADASPNSITYIIHHLLMYYTGEWLVNCTGKTSTKLPKALSYLRVQGRDHSPKCVKGTTYMTTAVSPAFELFDYTSTNYSTWTESMWGADMGIRMYLVANPQIEGILLGCGLLMLTSSFGIVFFMSKKASVLFTPVILPSVNILETN